MKILDLYCGAGGLGFGFEMTGAFKVSAGIDIYPPALDSFYKNHKIEKRLQDKYSVPTDLSLEQVRTEIETDFKGIDIVVGGPPCQGFSAAGKRLDDYLEDPRNHQVFYYLDIIDRLRPLAFVMENVSGISNTGQRSKFDVLKQLQDKFELIGYDTKFEVLKSEEFFVPQKRRRMFLVGTRTDLGTFYFPDAQSSAEQNLFRKKSLVTVKNSIGDLPHPNDGSFLQYDKNTNHWFQDMMRHNSLGVQAHFETKHKEGFIEKLKNQEIGKPLYSTWNHSWVKLNPDSIAPTIKENHRAPGIHYDRPMSISPRECARLQSMPDRFQLVGTKSQSLILVGNAVPPLLGAAVATSLAKSFRINDVKEFGVSDFLQGD